VQCGTEIIRIVLVEIRGSKARIGVEAERTVQIDREEVYLAKQREKNGGSA
jgi:sRNA-binding carbon storage regulator CsrA